MLLDLPLELQLSIYEGSGNLHLKEVCQEVKEVFDANLYGMNDFLTKTNVKQKTISQVSVDVVKKYSNDKELMTDLILRSIPQPKPSYTSDFGFPRMTFGMIYNDMAYNNIQFMNDRIWNHIRISQFQYLFLNLPHYAPYDIIKKQTEVTFDPIILNDIESTIEKLIKTNDKETIMKLVEIHSDLTNKSPDYTKILKICASNNNFELYKEFYTVIKKSDQNSYNFVSIFTVEYFVKYENISALEYFHENMDISYDKIITHSIKINSHRVFDQYFNKINQKDHGQLIAHINNTIKYNNVYAFKKLICKRDVLKMLLEQKCRTILNNEEKTMSYLLAVMESCKCNQEFVNVMNSLITTYLTITNSLIDENQQLFELEINKTPKIYKDVMQFNKFNNVQYMKYQQRSHKNYNKQKFIKH